MTLRLAMFLGFMAVAAPAAADVTIPLDGNYGNEDGCALSEGTGSYNDLIEQLTAEGVSNAVMYCGFQKITEQSADRIVVDVSCGYEGGETQIDLDVVTITTAKDGTRTASFKTGGYQIGPLRKCAR